MKFTEFVEELYRFGLERFRRYYGPYRAIVVDNKDPEQKGRIQVSCVRARLGGDNGIWLWPMMHGAGITNRYTAGQQNACGIFWPPEIGEAVWIHFDNGDPVKPLCYIGGWYGGETKSELHKDILPDANGAPNKRGFISPGGSKIIFNDSSGSEQIIIEHTNGQRVLLTKDEVLVGDKNGVFQPTLMGETTKTWMNTHTHATIWGPTTPPVVPLPESALTKNTKVT